MDNSVHLCKFTSDPAIILALLGHMAQFSMRVSRIFQIDQQNTDCTVLSITKYKSWICDVRLCFAFVEEFILTVHLAECVCVSFAFEVDRMTLTWP